MSRQYIVLNFCDKFSYPKHRQLITLRIEGPSTISQFFQQIEHKINVSTIIQEKCMFFRMNSILLKPAIRKKW